MPQSPLSVPHRDHARAQQDHRIYTLRVRNTVFLWGSAGVSVNMHFQTPLLLHVHNDKFGENILIGTQTADGARQQLGSLDPGEFLSIPIQDLSAVYATCQLESAVTCMIR